MGQNKRKMETKRLNGIDLFHALMSKVARRLVQGIIPVLCDCTKYMLNAIIHQRRGRRGKKCSHYGLISRQTMLDAELIDMLASKVGAKLIPMGGLKAIGLGGKVLRGRILVINKQSLSVGDDSRPPIALAQNDASDGIDRVRSSVGKVLGSREAAKANERDSIPDIPSAIALVLEVPVPQEVEASHVHHENAADVAVLKSSAENNLEAMFRFLFHIAVVTCIEAVRAFVKRLDDQAKDVTFISREVGQFQLKTTGIHQ